MQVEKECEPYLSSTEAIGIIQSGNGTFINRLLRCIGRHKHMVCTGAILRHQHIHSEILLLRCDIAFEDAQLLFIEKVKQNVFSPDSETCLPYIKRLFMGNYLNEYRKELVRAKAVLKAKQPETGSRWETTQSETAEKIERILSAFSPEECHLYRLRYEEGMNLTEIAMLLQKPYQSVKDQFYRFHRHFENDWQAN